MLLVPRQIWRFQHHITLLLLLTIISWRWTLGKYIVKIELMPPTILGLWKNCDGICHYFTMNKTITINPMGDSMDVPHGNGPKCASEEGEGKLKDQQLPLYCDVFLSVVEVFPSCGQDQGVKRDTLTEFMCSEDATDDKSGIREGVYKVTLGRALNPRERYCKSTRVTSLTDDGAGIPCVPEEFIAISFSADEADFVSNEQLFYVCTLGNEYVEAWIPYPTTSGRRIKDTRPFLNLAPGVIFSRIDEAKSEHGFVCSFTIMGKAYNYTIKTDDKGYETHTFHFASFGNGNGWAFKIVQGLVYRDEDTGDVQLVHLRPGFVEETSARKLIVRLTGTELPINPLADSWEVLAGEGQLTKELIRYASPRDATDAPVKIDENETNLRRIDDVYRSCILKKTLCYNLEKERGCVHREKCHVLISIKANDKDFETVHFDVIAHMREFENVVKRTRPSGWTAFAFSEDETMGSELAFVCAFHGRDSYNIYAVTNGLTNSKYEENQTYQNYLQNKEYYVGHVTNGEAEPRVLCSFDLSNTNFTYEHGIGREDPVDLTLDLKTKEYFVLLAQGPTTNDRWFMSMHDTREVLPYKFSKAIYDAKVNKGTLSIQTGRIWLGFGITTVIILSYIRN